MRLIRPARGTRPLQRLQDAIAHLTGCLTSEGNSKNLFRLLNSGKQTKVTLREQFGFSRTRRCLDNKGATGVNGFSTGLCIGQDRHIDCIRIF